jgi:hypothetical protein
MFERFERYPHDAEPARANASHPSRPVEVARGYIAPGCPHRRIGFKIFER